MTCGNAEGIPVQIGHRGVGTGHSGTAFVISPPETNDATHTIYSPSFSFFSKFFVLAPHNQPRFMGNIRCPIASTSLSPVSPLSHLGPCSHARFPLPLARPQTSGLTSLPFLSRAPVALLRLRRLPPNSLRL